MPKREDETARNIMQNSVRNETSGITTCPACGGLTLFYNSKLSKYVCTNKKCLIVGETLKEIRDKHARTREAMERLFM